MNKSTQGHLNAIAERLRNNQASLFVGAGFSKNAQLQDGAKLPPNWDELGDLFFVKSRNRKPNKADRAYANVLRLAEEVENMFGRPALAELIKEALNDERLTPSDTHMQLLALPWQDVYTTNYDTLLDRCAVRLKEQDKRSYTIVWNSQKIGMGSSPYLMKVHGDINEPSSIIITEEDYRRYPAEHPAMINHIQHTIMTKTLVLVGFSGNDPNFIQWLGWVRDALQNNQRKLYMLSIDRVSEAARVYFEKKNVVVVDIKGFGGKGSSPSESIAAAIRYLEEYPLKREEEKKEYRRKTLKWGRTSHRDEEIGKTLELWIQERAFYPGWLVMPRDKREYLANMEGFYLPKDKLSQLGDGADILFLDLFNWRNEKCLYPIENDWENVYLSVLAKYQPFKGRCRSTIRTAWLNLKLGLLRMYRQEGWRGKWNDLRNELLPLKSKMSDDQRCRFDYEQALEAVYRNDFKWLEEVLLQWGKSSTDHYWDIRRGALWAEYLSFETGIKITREAFNDICDRLDNSVSEKERFYWASRKVHAHTVWNCMAQANFSDGRDETASARETWLELRPYEDVWYEREYFDRYLRPIEDTLRVTRKTATFRLGQSSTSTSMSGNSKDYRVAYAYFLYYEEMGFPIHLPYLSSYEKSSLDKALSVMAYCSPAIAECWLLRSGDPKMVQAVYNRRFLERTSFAEVDALYRRYLDCFSQLLQIDDSGVVPSWVLVFRSILPEILARLCMKASYESRVKTLDYIDVVFREKESIRYDGLDRFLSSLISSFSREEIVSLIPKLARMAIARDRLGWCGLEPFYYVHVSVEVADSLSDVIDDLLDRWGKDEQDDKAISLRLLFLNRCKALSNRQQEVLKNKLWSNRDAYGFPTRTIYHRFAFLGFPHPKEVDPQTLLKEYFNKQFMPIVGKGSSVSFYGGHVPILNDLEGTTHGDIPFIWDKTLLNRVCGQLIEMWNSDKEWLLKEERMGFGFSVKEEFQARFGDVDTIVSTIIAPHLQMLDDKQLEGLKRMTAEFESYGMPSFRMRLALSDIVGLDGNNPREFFKRLNSSDDRIIDDCMNALLMLYKKGKDVTQWVEWISESFRCNAEHGRIPLIGTLNYFVDKKEVMSNEAIRDNLLFGLDRLYADTVVETTDDELTASDKMNLRRSVAPIVKGLMRGVSGGMPQTLSIWRDYYNNDNTCWDIKNAFIDN